MDPTTLSKTREKFSRVCEEVNFLKLLILLISVMWHIQAVEYEGLHLICFDCGKYGHPESTCPKVVQECD